MKNKFLTYTSNDYYGNSMALKKYILQKYFDAMYSIETFDKFYKNSAQNHVHNRVELKLEMLLKLRSIIDSHQKFPRI